jgi:acetate kinase
MQVLVLNCGSSSLKADLLDVATGARCLSILAERLGTAEAVVHTPGSDVVQAGMSHAVALDLVVPLLTEALPAGETLAGVGHRVVHGGDRFTAPTRIDDDVVGAIEDLIELAPLHNPPALEGIRAARRLLPDVPHVAVFDTAFHATLPRRARTYAIDDALAQRHGIRRFGFHGTSHAYVARQAARFLDADVRDLRIITCHLGNGCSAAAVEYGRSVETTMGMTPLEGLVMGTRSGDLDPGVLLHLMRAEGLDANEMDQLLNRKSGLAGLSGVGNDMRDIEQGAKDGDERCRLALQVFAHRVRKYVGAYAATMGGVDAIVFCAGIGENSALVRHRIVQRLEFIGAHIDEDRNRNASVDSDTPVARISADGARVQLLVVATDEAREIGMQTAALIDNRDVVETTPRIPVAVSARHVHLTAEMVERLYGPGHTLTRYKDISQPGQYACEERVTLVGPKRQIEGVRIIGPVRSGNQVEISRTDEFHLGIDAPVRDSGHTKNSPGITLVGPAGTVNLTHGVICARRHIHMHPDDAKRFGVADKDVVEVAVDTEGRDLIFGDVLVRVSPKYVLEMHIDTDEANAAELSTGHPGVLVGVGGGARLRRKAPTTR